MFAVLLFLALAQGFDFDTNHALLPINQEIVDLRLNEPKIPHSVRATVISPLAAWEAIAPYTESGLGILTDANALRRPSSERTNENKNKAMFYSMLRGVLSLQPQDTEFILEVYRGYGLDPLDNHTGTDPVGLGNIVGEAVRIFLETDGTNQMGDMGPSGPQEFNRMNYSDYTGYVPVNSPFGRLRDPDCWQPLMEYGDRLEGARKNIVQQTFTTPQYGLKKPFGDISVSELVSQIPDPFKYRGSTRSQFIAQVEEVIDVSATLTDRQKMIAEYFENKGNLPNPVRALFRERGVPSPRNPLDVNDVEAIDAYVKGLLFTGLATEDALISIWNAKAFFDAVRPVTAVREGMHRRGKTITAHARNLGPREMDRSQFDSYIPTDSHPEYPSGTTCLNRVLVRFVALIRGNGTAKYDDISITANFPQGSSIIEPGITPKEAFSITWTDLRDYQRDAADSRIFAGVHFRRATEVIGDFCDQIGDGVYRNWVRLMNGEPLLYKY